MTKYNQSFYRYLNQCYLLCRVQYCALMVTQLTSPRRQSIQVVDCVTSARSCAAMRRFDLLEQVKATSCPLLQTPTDLIYDYSLIALHLTWAFYMYHCEMGLPTCKVGLSTCVMANKVFLRLCIMVK